jgi:hypothetical protein
MRASTVLTRARRSQAALALDPLPASKVQSDPPEIAEFDKHNSKVHVPSIEDICQAIPLPRTRG